MARIEIDDPHPAKGAPATQLVIDGVDVSDDVYRDVDLVVIGDDPAVAEIGLRVTFVISDLCINGQDVAVAREDFFTLLGRIRAMNQVDA